jgi:two-component system, cell cycle response regulator CtrA
MELEAYMSQADSESTIRTGMLVVNLDTRVVSVNEKPLHLTGKEYGILELLSRRKGTTLTKEMFLDHLYAGVHEPEIKIIDVFVCKLRKKLAQATGGSHYIETVWGRGYVLRDPPANTASAQALGHPDRSNDARFRPSQQPARLLESSAVS